MVFGIITAIAACPAIVGTNEAVMQGQRQNMKERHRGLKTSLYVNCVTASRGGAEVNGGRVVLRDNILIVATSTKAYLEDCENDHPFAGYYLPYPERSWGRQGEGLVSTISDDPPQLNWIYVNIETHELKYGTRLDSEDHITGPWDCTKVDKRLTLEGWEGFIAVYVGPGEWQLFFDRNDDGLAGMFPEGTRTVEVELVRRERRNRRQDPEPLGPD
ncbi:hypothetical protein EJ08DRAFT_671249 [Tothia fuscella]|uniref:Uncharacterized protein n=1 Tax=Tothia fuscella TaxID=1048955 RepID=A0A9P4TW91_9PEZI|nr:hypothetical protein EJ08DRAFT_671249 [Tothia fuscella]